MNPSISVIIPTWNRGQTVLHAVRSALCQTHAPVEVLVCDDGSTDDTAALIKGLAESRVKWVPGSHNGCPAIPRNRGLRAAQGDWIAFLDSDDEWLPEKLQAQISAANQSGHMAICSNARRVSTAGVEMGNVAECTGPLLTFADLLQVNSVVTSSAVVHRSMISLAGEFPAEKRMRAIEDYAYWLRIATQTEFSFVGRPLVRYRDDPAGSVRRHGLQTLELQKRAVLRDFVRWSRRCGALHRPVPPYRQSMVSAFGGECRQYAHLAMRDFIVALLRRIR